ncbi:MAG TPA: 30S ribosomal protein S6 [Ktedonobacterales bacterium]|jgi:small subunit ribosomal protein S6|nr:30S ribosomal protein S6 [Ktedonobacterales bacterium]
MARDYELGIVINPEIGDEQARSLVERVTTIITNHSGQVVRVNAWGRRRLAYPIQRFRDGLYFFFDLILEPSTIAEIERNLRVNEDIIRHLLKVRDPRVVAQQRQRDIELDTQREADAKAQAEAEAARAAAAANAPAAEAEEPAQTEVTAEGAEGAEASAPETTETGSDEPEAATSETAQAEA